MEEGCGTALKQRSAAWHLARQGKLTASNLGAALGLVSYVSRDTAFRRAMGTDKFEGNTATRWGTENEMNGIMEYQWLSGNLVDATGLHVHPSYHWLAGSPDGLVGTEGMIEVKCPYFRRRDGSILHKTIPKHYYLQVNALLTITGRAWCDYVCWCTDGVCAYRVYQDDALFNWLLSFYGQFYAAMQSGAAGPPPLSVFSKAQIIQEIDASMQKNVDYGFYTNADPGCPPPSSDPYDGDEDEAQPMDPEG